MRRLALRLGKLATALCHRRLRQALRHGCLAAVEHGPLLRRLQPVTVVDVGANVGQFALAARHALPSATIHAFEPLPRPAAVFAQVFADDAATRLTSIALGAHAGEADMHLSARDDSSSLLPIGPDQVRVFPGTGAVGRQRVTVARLDRVLDGVDLTAPALLKIDVQGTELEVLRGCGDRLAAFDHLLIEASFLPLYVGQSLAADVIAYAASQGFVLDGVHHPITTRNGQRVQADLLFRRAETRGLCPIGARIVGSAHTRWGLRPQTPVMEVKEAQPPCGSRAAPWSAGSGGKGPTAWETGFAVAGILFVLLLLTNGPTLTTDITLRGDLAADLLLTQRAAHGWLLTGPSATYGVHHPGPFFLYIRLLGQELAGRWTASAFGAQLVGVMACGAAFAGLFAALLQCLARREGACGGTAAGAAVAALVLVLVQVSFHGRLADVFVGVPGGPLANFWMPEFLILPFLTFLAAAALLLRGAIFGLMAATFCAATLGHGYIPMPMVVGPVWLVAAILGERTRLARIGRGFPPLAWAGVALIGAVFALPLVLDAVVNPPGNLVEVLNAAAQSRQASPLLSPYEVLKLLGHPWHEIRPGLWLAVLAGLAISIATGRYRGLWRDGLLVTGLAIMTAALTFAQTPEPPRWYTALFFGATALLPIAVGTLVVTLELGRRRRVLALAGAGSLLLLFPVMGSLFTPYRDAVEVHAVARIIAAENPSGRRVALESQKITGLISGVLLDLDRFGMAACSNDSTYGYYYTPERLCPRPFPPGVPVYRLFVTPCPSDPPSLVPERVGQDSIVRAMGYCFHVARSGPET